MKKITSVAFFLFFVCIAKAQIDCPQTYEERSVKCNGTIGIKCVPIGYSCKDCWLVTHPPCPGHTTGGLDWYSSYQKALEAAEKHRNENNSCPLYNDQEFTIYCDDSKFCNDVDANATVIRDLISQIKPFISRYRAEISNFKRLCNGQPYKPGATYYEYKSLIDNAEERVNNLETMSNNINDNNLAEMRRIFNEMQTEEQNFTQSEIKYKNEISAANENQRKQNEDSKQKEAEEKYDAINQKYEQQTKANQDINDAIQNGGQQLQNIVDDYYAKKQEKENANEEQKERENTDEEIEKIKREKDNLENNNYSSSSTYNSYNKLSNTPSSTTTSLNNMAEVKYKNGTDYFNKKDYTNAIIEFTNAIKLNKDYRNAYWNRGAAYRANGDYQLAIYDYNAAITLTSDKDKESLAQLYNNKARNELNLKQNQPAIEDFSSALSFNPNIGDAYWNRGIAFDNNSDYQHAVDDYNTALNYYKNDLKSSEDLKKNIASANEKNTSKNNSSTTSIKTDSQKEATTLPRNNSAIQTTSAKNYYNFNKKYTFNNTNNNPSTVAASLSTGNNNNSNMYIKSGYHKDIFQYFGINGKMQYPDDDLIRIFRWYIPDKNQYVIVADKEYADGQLINWGWKGKTLLFYAYHKPGAGRVAVYRWYNPVTEGFISITENESDSQMLLKGFTQKQFQFYALTQSGDNTVSVFLWLFGNYKAGISIPE